MPNATELARELIRALEAERGVPVQATADIPESDRYGKGAGIKGREIFGSFYERPAKIKSVPKLDKKYVHDVALLEGEYSTLNEAIEKAEKLGAPFRGYTRASEPVYELLHKEVRAGNLKPRSEIFDIVLPPSPLKKTKKIETQQTRGARFAPADFFIGSEAEKVHRLLDDAGITHLYHRITIRPDGVFDDRTFGGSISIIDETKIADVIIELMK